MIIEGLFVASIITQAVGTHKKRETALCLNTGVYECTRK